MSIGERRFQALVDKGVKEALGALKKCGGVKLTKSERAMLEFGVGCGIKATVEEYTGDGAPHQSLTNDHFSE